MHEDSLTCKAPQALPRARTLRDFVAAGMPARSMVGIRALVLQCRLRSWQHATGVSRRACDCAVMMVAGIRYATVHEYTRKARPLPAAQADSAARRDMSRQACGTRARSPQKRHCS